MTDMWSLEKQFYEQGFSVICENGYESSRVKTDVKPYPLGLYAEKMLADYEMARTGDWKKLGDALQNGQKCDFQHSGTTLMDQLLYNAPIIP